MRACSNEALEKKKSLGLPWWLNDKESACQCRRHKLDPWSGKIPLVWQQLSPYITTIEPVLQSRYATSPEACMPQGPWSTRHATTVRSPNLPQLEQSPRSNQDPEQPKNKLKKNFFLICIAKAGFSLPLTWNQFPRFLYKGSRKSHRGDCGNDFICRNHKHPLEKCWRIKKASLWFCSNKLYR